MAESHVDAFGAVFIDKAQTIVIVVEGVLADSMLTVVVDFQLVVRTNDVDDELGGLE